MNYTLGLYEKAMPKGLSFEQMLLATRRAGFDRMEISIDETDERLSRLDGGWDELSLAIKNARVPVTTMCLSGHRRFPAGSHDPEIRRKSVEIMRKAVEFSAETGVRLIQLAGYDVYYEQGDADTKRWFLEGLAQFVDCAATHGVALGFETMETEFMDTVGKAMKYVKLIDSPYLGVYPDIGNLKNASVKYETDLVEDLRAGRGHIFAAHLKETRPGIYRDMEFGQGHTQYAPCLDELIRQGVRMFTGEFWFSGESDTDARLKSAARFLRLHIDDAIKRLK
ncbi:MAG: L-ribulose-5-phosphate 3-epimerase, partial [Clostridia bacterium]|nr:L-ribulose-5-phosphate 3-epimerase [Clostridia bacterium]